MTEAITEFRGDYYFLSNMYPCSVTVNGVTYKSAESAYQAQKSGEFVVFAALDGYKAKQMSKNFPTASDWMDNRVRVMENVLLAKFTDPKLVELLYQTGDAELVHDNTHNDRFWGVYNGKGTNVLGLLLMRVRQYIQEVV